MTVTSTYAYTVRGEVASETGSAAYPIGYTYDDYGQVATMTTQSAAGAGVTTWVYESGTGRLL